MPDEFLTHSDLERLRIGDIFKCQHNYYNYIKDKRHNRLGALQLKIVMTQAADGETLPYVQVMERVSGKVGDWQGLDGICRELTLVKRPVECMFDMSIEHER
jgi:hypothetical protein